MSELSIFQKSFSNAPVDIIDAWGADNLGVRLMIKREDLIHSAVSGNKWRKLKHNLQEAGKLGFSTLLTFGGAFSNHIYATSAAGKIFGFRTIGIIRGEQPEPLNPTLLYSKENGMQLFFVNRRDYQDKKDVLSKLPINLGDIYILPEGGTNSLALKGCSEIITEYPDHANIDYWCVPCGTGGTLAGMVTSLTPQQKAIGFSVLKGEFLKNEVEKLLSDYNNKKYQNWSINSDYHFGGYAKFNNDLIEFINEFKTRYHIQLDPIYTGKMLFGIVDLIKKGYFPAGSTIMAIHTGGQQGISGFNQRFGNIVK